MRSRINIEIDRAKTESEKQTEVLLDIRDLLIEKEKPKSSTQKKMEELME